MSNETDMKDRNVKLTIYRELCASYRAIDDFRAKLLGLLPLATGTGIFLLLGDKTKLNAVAPYLGPIGVFGFVVTLGLFSYEIFAIKKCGALISAGTELEKQLEKGYISHGQFVTRPNIFINEPFAAGIIYSAVLAAWIYLASITIYEPSSDPLVCIPNDDFALVKAITVFFISFAVSFFFRR